MDVFLCVGRTDGSLVTAVRHYATTLKVNPTQVRRVLGRVHPGTVYGPTTPPPHGAVPYRVWLSDNRAGRKRVGGRYELWHLHPTT